MRTVLLTILAGFLAVAQTHGQLKSQEQTHTSVASSLIRPAPSMSGLLGWFNPDNFMMRHSFSFQYVSGAGYGLSLASYTNSMFYRIADPLDVRFDVSLMGSPFGQFGLGDQASFNRLILSRAELNYRPWENVYIRLQYRHLPYYGYGWYSPYYFPSTSTAAGDE